jgi:hypothetical protein
MLITHSVALRQTDSLQPHAYFTQEVSKAFVGGACRDVYDPFPQRAFIYQGAPPERPRDTRFSVEHVEELFSRNVRHSDLGERSHTMIHLVQNERMKIAERVNT